MNSLRHRYLLSKNIKLVIVSLVIGLLSALLAITLKHISEHYEEVLFSRSQQHKVYLIFFPFTGLTLIYILRKYLFKKKLNKGISEVFLSTGTGKNLPAYKIPSHFINGLLTVSFGGSTGVEVSTVVATAAIGSLAQEKERIFRKHKKDLICAGVAAGITALFCSPLAGLFFAYEVISKRTNRFFLITTVPSVIISFILVLVTNEQHLFPVEVVKWNVYAIPYFMLFGIVCGINSIYLTKCVLFFKKNVNLIRGNYTKVVLVSIAITLILLGFPQLYGDGYHAVKECIYSPGNFYIDNIWILFLLLVLKPVITSLTLSGGGDGGVFAPSLFLGAFAGSIFATLLNTYFQANVIQLNFIVIGMAAMLSASIHAPFTALFLVCALFNDYSLFIPIFISCLVAKYAAKAIYPYTVYTILPAKS